MSCNIVINQQASLPVSDKITPDVKIKDPEGQKRGKKSHETYMKKLNDRFLKDKSDEFKRMYKLFLARFE